MESATVLEIDEATKEAVKETRIKPAHCKFPVVGIPWLVVPYSNCKLTRQEIGYVGTHLQLSEAEVMEDVELRFTIKVPAAFLIFMLEGEITFINEFGKQVVQAQASNFFMAYSSRQTFRYRMPKGKHSILVIEIDSDWLLPFAGNYPAFNQLLQNWKKGTKGEMVLPMHPIGQPIKQHLYDIRTTIVNYLDDVFKVPLSIKECIKVYHNLLMEQQIRLLEADNTNTATIIGDYIKDNFYLPAMCEEETMANQLHLSKWKVREVVQDYWGTTVHAYVEKLRMEKAKWLLENTNIKIREISYQCGYWDAAHFTHAFKKYYGITPRIIRNSNNKIFDRLTEGKNCKFFC